MHRYDLVSFSFGGDDIGFESIMIHCVESRLKVSGCPPDASVRQKITQLGTTGVFKGSLHIPPFPSFLEHVATASVVHGGNVIVMGYPEIFERSGLWGPKETTCAGLSKSTVDELRGWAGDLNATLGISVAKANAVPASNRNDVHFTFVNPVTGGGFLSPDDPNLFEPAGGPAHELCSQGQNIWMNGFSELNVDGSFHPNQAGETAMGHLVAEVVPHLTWPWTPSWRQLASLPASVGPAGFGPLSCASGPYCMASSGADVYVWSGGSWATAPSPSGPGLGGVSCVSATFCMGIYDTVSGPETSSSTDTHTSYATSWTGKSWSSPVELDSYQGIEGYGTVQAVSCTSAKFCMAIGGEFGSVIWNGSTWHREPGQTAGTDGGTSLACTSPTFCMAAPANPSTIEWNGRRWGPATQPVGPPTGWLAEVTCLTSSECFGTALPNTTSGEQPYRFDGKAWTPGASTETPSTSSISCRDLDVLRVGRYQRRCLHAVRDDVGATGLAGAKRRRRARR